MCIRDRVVEVRCRAFRGLWYGVHVFEVCVSETPAYHLMATSAFQELIDAKFSDDVSLF